MKYIPLFLIILLAIFFRFYNLPSVPPSPSLDEVTIGYNAYSLLQTGRDEYGNKFPVLLRAYDDWRPALYVYLVIPFVKLFGLNVLSVRLPSVIMSVLTVLATYFLAKQIFSNFRVGLLAAFLLAISPWHIYISRLGHEVNAGLTFVVFGALFFLMAVNTKKGRWMIIISAVFFSLSFYTYQSEKVFTPLLVLILATCYWEKLLLFKKELIISVIIGLLVTLPIFQASLSPQGLIRLRGTSAFSNLDQNYAQNAKQLILDKQHGSKIAEIFDNRRFVPVKVFLGNYFSHFNLYWLYGNNGSESFKAPYIGLFYPWEFIFLVIGIIFLTKDISLSFRVTFVLFFWILISFIAPAITTQAPHAMRAITILPIPQIIEAYGILCLFILIAHSKNYLSKIIVSLYIGIITILSMMSLYKFYQQYFFAFPKEQSESFQYALAKANVFVLQHEKQYDTIVFSNFDNLYQSYMFYLFAKQYDPLLYQEQGGTKSGGFAETHQFGKYEFRPINPINGKKEKKNKNTLYVANPQEVHEHASVLFSGYYLDGKVGVIVYE